MFLLSLLIELFAVILSLLAIFINQWVTLIPQMGVESIYHIRALRLAVALICLALAAGGVILVPTDFQWCMLVLVVILTPFSGYTHARRFLLAINNPRHARVDEGSLADGAGVMGIEMNGQAHSWPVEMLIPHHIFNDEVGGIPVLASWCAYCRGGAVYAATVRGRHLHFSPQAVWRRNMIMRDQETGTLWQQATGEALIGPLKRGATNVFVEVPC